MMSAAPIAQPADVAWFLASYARDALAQIEEKKSDALTPLRKSLEEALGISFKGEKGEHFFSSTLVQTFVLWSVFSLGQLV